MDPELFSDKGFARGKTCRCKLTSIHIVLHPPKTHSEKGGSSITKSVFPFSCVLSVFSGPSVVSAFFFFPIGFYSCMCNSGLSGLNGIGYLLGVANLGIGKYETWG